MKLKKLYCLTFQRKVQTPFYAPLVQKLKDALSSRISSVEFWRLVTDISREYIGHFFRTQTVLRPWKNDQYTVKKRRLQPSSFSA